MRTLLCWLALAGLLYGLSLRFDHVIEDAYISFRYADNLARGEGIVFNPGEAPVEGYSNFLWVLILGLASIVGISIPVAARVLGFGSALGILWVVYAMAREHLAEYGRSAQWFALGAPTLLVLWPSFQAWPLSGMETCLFSLLLALAVRGYMRRWSDIGSADLKSGEPAVRWEPLVLTALCMTRPEGLFFAIGLIGIGWLKNLRRGRGLSACIERSDIWCFILPILAFILWKWGFYGAPLPNSFYAKYGIQGEHWSLGGQYLKQFIMGGGGVMIMGPVLAIVWRPLRSFVWAGWGVVLFIFIVAYMGGDIYPFSRYCVPIGPAAAVITVCAARRLYALSKAPWRWAWVVSGACLLLAVARPPGMAGEVQTYQGLRVNDEARIAFAGQARTWIGPRQRIAIQDAGIIPFFLKNPTVDMLGLNDEYIGNRRLYADERGVFGHEKHDAEYVLDRKPDWVFMVLHHWTLGQVEIPGMPDRGPIPFEKTFPLIQMRFDRLPAQSSLWEMPAFKLAYRPEVIPLGNSRMVLYRRDPAFIALLEAVKAGRLDAGRAKPLFDGFIQKGAYLEGEEYLVRLARRQGDAVPILAAYRAELERLAPDRMRSYRIMREALVRSHADQVERNLREGDPAAAWRILNRAMILYPDQPALFSLRGGIFSNAKNWQMAEACYRRAIEAGGATPGGWTSLGMAQAAGGRKAEAERSFQAALRLDPNYLPAREGLFRSGVTGR